MEEHAMRVRGGRTVLLICALFVTTGSFSQSQEPARPSVGPLSAEPRFFAPFSAKVITKAVQRTPARSLSRTATAAYYRDSFGRVRVEYKPLLETGREGPTAALVMPNPYARTDRVFMVDDDAKVVELTDVGILGNEFNATKQFSIPTASRRFTDFPTIEFRSSGGGLYEELGSRVIGGVRANGTRFTTSLWPAAVDERWESPELGVVLYARSVDKERGFEVEYTLTDIQTTEPSQDLFVLPAGYQYSPHLLWRFESPEAELRRLSGK